MVLPSLRSQNVAICIRERIILDVQNKGLLECVYETWFERGTPAVILYTIYIGGFFVELFHGTNSKAFECASISTSVWQQIKERHKLRESFFANCCEEVVRKCRASMRGGDSRYGQNMEFSILEMRGQIATI